MTSRHPPWEDDPEDVSPPTTEAPTPSDKSEVNTLSQKPDDSIADPKRKILDFFPLPQIRKSQELVILEAASAFASGYKIVLLEAPVGSGKSAIATTFAKSVGSLGTHLITPRKSLQDQYFDDFGDDLVLMKGRNAYPCTIDYTPTKYKSVINLIKTGRIQQPAPGVASCSGAPCTEDSEVYTLCTDEKPCPYAVAMELAQNNSIVVHNVHSFIFQSSFANKFEKREFLIVDEAHEIESTIRSFLIKKVFLSGVNITREEISSLKTWDQWQAYLLQDKLIPEESPAERSRKSVDKNYKTAKDVYIDSVHAVNLYKNLDSGFSVEIVQKRSYTGRLEGTILEFVPVNIGWAVQKLLLDFGEKTLLMSGTIYNKDVFCKNLGISPDKVYFIKIGSSFPKQNRPIYCVDRYQVDTSHAQWNENFAEVVNNINKISNIFHDVKGLIHTPSYAASEQLKNALDNPRFVAHTPQDFQLTLNDFYADKTPRILLSPICQQGVDFKGDRARFQIILRVPYQNTTPQFIQDKMKNDFSWYNYQALVVFGQQIGRVNRSEDDFGATFLMDSRFHQFLRRNAKVLPQWVKDAIVWR